MKEKVKCKKCGILIDKEKKICPFCGYPLDIKDTENDHLPKQSFKKERAPLEIIDGTNCYFFQIHKHIILFLLGTVLMTIFQLFAQIIIEAATSKEFLQSINGLTYINIFAYSATFLVMFLFLFRYLPQFSKNTTVRINNFVPGIIGAACLISFSVLYSFVSTNLGATISNNQNLTMQIIKQYPSVGLIILGFVGPIVEELTYRLGLFSSIRKHNRIGAYLVVSLIFGLIHFNFSSINTPNQLINELINFPSYALSGAILCFIYEKYGLENSILAHILNNLISVVQIMYI